MKPSLSSIDIILHRDLADKTRVAVTAWPQLFSVSFLQLNKRYYSQVTDQSQDSKMFVTE